MPARYEAIKKNLLKKGLSSKMAKSQAARIYQKTRRDNEPELNAAVAAEKKEERTEKKRPPAQERKEERKERMK